MNHSAQQSAPPPPVELSSNGADQRPLTEPRLTLDEMTRVMDVARTLRKQRSIAERELNRTETIAVLRDKLREAADLTGDPVTDEQIEIAIEHYFDNLHEFEPAEPGLSTFLASIYVRRTSIAVTVISLAALATIAFNWWFG